MNKRPDVLIELALLALRRVRRFLGDRSMDQYIAVDQCQSAIEGQLEIAGAACAQGDVIRAAICWRRMGKSI